MGVQAGVSVVSHHPELVRWNRDGGHVIGHRFAEPGFLYLSAIAEQLPVPHFQLITRLANNTFDQGRFGVVARLDQSCWWGEHNDAVPAEMVVFESSY